MINYENIHKNLENKRYPFLGAGSGRYVYDLGNEYVVKVAMNRKGFAQNRAEFQISSTIKSELLARIIGISKDEKYIIMSKATAINSISEIWNYYHVRNNYELCQLESFRHIAEKGELLMNDLCRKRNWGWMNGRPVIIDYGFTRDTKKYYTIFG